MAEGGTKLDVSCSICFEEYDTPKVLPCGHTFCCQCLSKMLHTHSTHLDCPKCRKEVPLPNSGKISDLPTNFELMAITADQRQGRNITSRAIMTKGFTNKKAAVNQCLKHGKPFEFLYCKSCKIQVCAHCLLREHMPSKHEIITKSAFAKNLIAEVEKLKGQLEQFRDKERSLGDNIMKSKISLEQQYSDIQAEISRKVVQEQEKIKRQGETLLRELADKKTAFLCLFTDLQTQHTTLSSLFNQTEEKCNLLKEEFLKLNISREKELAKVSKSLVFLNIQTESLGQTFKTTPTKALECDLQETFHWDLGKLIPTVDAERLTESCHLHGSNLDQGAGRPAPCLDKAAAETMQVVQNKVDYGDNSKEGHTDNNSNDHRAGYHEANRHPPANRHGHTTGNNEADGHLPNSVSYGPPRNCVNYGPRRNVAGRKCRAAYYEDYENSEDFYGDYQDEYNDSYIDPYRGCYYCGEPNHKARNCKYAGPLQCRVCGQWGHKEKWCHNRNGY